MIYHHTNTSFDIEALTTLGVSVKTEGSIGYFGTGFKFALATLLRTGHSVTIHSADQTFAFTSRTKDIRGTSFSLVCMNGTPLGFTTEFGKNWEVWMAFRELHSNTLDENGWTDHRRGEAATIITVAGPAYTDVYHKRHEIFIDEEPDEKDGDIEIFLTPKPHKYYRGVRAGNWDRPTIFGYNLLMRATLTEDRTVASNWFYERNAADLILISENRELIERAVMAPEGSLEHQFEYRGAPSETFLKVVEENKASPRLSYSALQILFEVKPSAEEIPSITLTEAEERELRRAWKVIAKLGVEPYPVTFIEPGDGNSLGFVRRGKVYVTRRAFDMGYRTLAGTLYEEHLHTVNKLRDCDRTMQNFLLDKLMMVLDKED